jgi:hypothetical protein
MSGLCTTKGVWVWFKKGQSPSGCPFLCLFLIRTIMIVYGVKWVK